MMKLARGDSESLTPSRLSDPWPRGKPHDRGGSLEPSLVIAIVSSDCLVCLGLQTILGNGKTGYVVQMHQRMSPELLLAERRPDLFIFDLETNRNAVDTIKKIRESAPNGKIVLLSGGEDRERLQEAFACGVDGVVLKVQPPGVVLVTIEALYPPEKNGGQAERNEVAGEGDLRKTFTRQVDSEPLPPAWAGTVSEREREVIRLVGQGLSNKEIAYRLCIADSTVRHHLTNIFDKVGVRNRQKLLIHTHQLHSTG